MGVTAKFFKPWLPLLLSGGITLLLLKLGLITALEPLAQNLLFQARGPQPWSDELVVVKIDQPSINALGWFPWRRDRYTQLLEQLTAAQADTIAFNILFSEETGEDPAFAAAMAEHGGVILASTWHADLHPWMPNPILAQQAAAIGHITQVKKTSLPTVLPQIQGYPALAIAATQTHQLKRGSLQLPDSDRPLFPNWPGPIAQVEQYSFVDVLEQRIPPAAFQNKIVLVGMTAAGFDPLATPFDSEHRASGVYLHAAMVHSFLEEGFLQTPSRYVWLLGLLSWGIVLRYGLSRLKEYKQLGIILVAILSWPVLGVMALSCNILLPIALPLVLFSASGIALLLFNYIRLNRLNHQLHNRATTDALTKLKNRAFFNDYSAYLWRDGLQGQNPLSLILCDVDHFKQYNDTYGHLDGDECLYQVAQNLRKSVYRSSDLVARYGGEEFVILLPNTPLKHACEIVERIQAQLSRQEIPHKSSPTAPHITLSLGVVSVIPSRKCSLRELLDQADQALYQAKQSGRNCFQAQQL